MVPMRLARTRNEKMVGAGELASAVRRATNERERTMSSGPAREPVQPDNLTIRDLLGVAPKNMSVEDGRVLKTRVTLDGFTGRGVAIRSGLIPGDRVIVEGWQKVSTGMKVTEE